jgi:hypothetical protein
VTGSGYQDSAMNPQAMHMRALQTKGGVERTWLHDGRSLVLCNQEPCLVHFLSVEMPT